MKTISVVTLVVACAIAIAGCGGKAADSGAASSTTNVSAGGATGGDALPAGLDDGPRAAATPVDESTVEAGEKLFQTRGCSACHGFGKRISCPDLDGVTSRRTAKWIETQILHPDVMTKQDPTARQLFAQYALQMPKQGLTPAEAAAVIEFLKHKNHESAEK